MDKERLIEFILHRSVSLHGVNIISTGDLVDWIDMQFVSEIPDKAEEVFNESGEIFKRV